MGIYTRLIKENLFNLKREDLDPVKVEEMMRVRHPTLDHLSRLEFDQEVSIAVEALNIGDGMKYWQKHKKDVLGT